MQAVRGTRPPPLPRPRAARCCGRPVSMAASQPAHATHAPPLVHLAKPLRVAVLNSPGNDPYAPMFSRLLGSALVDASQLVVDSFETEARQLPPHGAYDGYVLSGSRHGAYEALPWIAELLAWTREAVAKRDRLLGVCFGHQVIAQALGGRVEPNARGFEIGGLGMELTPQARAFFATLLGGEAATPEAVRMLYVHGCVCIRYAVRWRAPADVACGVQGRRCCDASWLLRAWRERGEPCERHERRRARADVAGPPRV